MSTKLRPLNSFHQIKSVKAEIQEDLNISYLNGIYGEPVMLPRVGEEYQAELPDLITCHTPNYAARMALEVPVFMWDPPSREGECKLLPGMRASTWIELEKEIFLLGIYIFGKRLNLVRRFLEGKKMGDVLCYYYGEFFKSDGHRKSKAKHCVVGTRIFSGWRQHKILSRLMESVPTGSHGQLQEIIKTYDQGESSFEDFIFTLKYATGALFLVQAIGIGNRKRDLTRIRSNLSSSRNQTGNHLEMPVGKGWSALSSEELMQFLTSKFRLGKARSNDIFWEAVWPRLLIRGWTSHKPRDRTLLFLVPGIDNFTDENLILGIHYFDSVTDLLSKVASNPELILVDEEGPLNSNENRDENKNKNHLYLRPKLPGLNLDPIKFTIIDTSIVEGEGPFKLRTVRYLPFDNTMNGVNALSNYPDKSQSNNSAIEDTRSQHKLKDCSVPLPKRRRLTACKKEYTSCRTKKCKDLENVENGSLWSHVQDTNQMICPKEVLKKEELKPVVYENTENEGLNDTHGRRHGTRNRPPTTKALESLALGLLGTKRRKKNNGMKSISSVPTCLDHKLVDTNRYLEVRNHRHAGMTIGSHVGTASHLVCCDLC